MVVPDTLPDDIGASSPHQRPVTFGLHRPFGRASVPSEPIEEIETEMSMPSQQGPLRPIRPIYHPSDDGNVLVYAGDLDLSTEDSTWVDQGDIVICLGPRPAFRAQFAGTQRWLFDMVMRGGKRPSVSLPKGAIIDPPTGSALPGQPELAKTWARDVIPMTHLFVGDFASADRVILHITTGSLSEVALPVCETTAGHQGQLPFRLPGWDLRLADVQRRRTDYDFTFVVEAVPRALPIDEAQVEQLTMRMLVLLSFLAGSEVGVHPIVGLDSNGRVVAARWAAPRVSYQSSGWRWCPDHLFSTALPILADGLCETSTNPAVDACVRRAIQLFLAANGHGVLDVKIPVACSGLELLAWCLLQDDGWLSPDGLSRLSAAGHQLRLLLKWAGMPITLPSDFTALDARGRKLSNPQLSGSDLVFNVRNALVHPPRKLTDIEWPSGEELFETWRLAMWYLELVILRVLGYEGDYISRLKLSGTVWDTERLPWVAAEPKGQVP